METNGYRSGEKEWRDRRMKESRETNRRTKEYSAEGRCKERAGKGRPRGDRNQDNNKEQMAEHNDEEEEEEDNSTQQEE